MVGSVLAAVPEAAGASLEPLWGSTSHWGEQLVEPGAGQAFVRAAAGAWWLSCGGEAAGVLHLGAAEAKGSSAGGPEDQEPLVVVTREASVDALLDGLAGWDQVCSSETLAPLADLRGAFAPGGHQGSAC